MAKKEAAMAQPTVTAILNVHREGLIAGPSMGSFKRTINHAETSGYIVEAVIIMDQPDELTSQVIEKCKLPHHRIYTTVFGDLAEARNFAISAAEGEYVAFLDADDLWGVNWLTRAVEAAKERRDNVIWHPEVSVYFGAAKHIFRHVDMESEEFEPVGLTINNYWTSLSFGSRAIYIDNPYPKIDLRAGFGFEDWAWNMQTISRGILHKIVPGTGHVIRRKTVSLAQQTVAAHAVPRPNDYLRWVIRKMKKTAIEAGDNLTAHQ